MNHNINDYITPAQAVEIDAQRTQQNITRRICVFALEEILYNMHPVLDHGFVRVIDYMGDDGAVVQAARVSYGRGTRKQLDDSALIGYLMRHQHSTPFEMCEIKLHVKLPIFVARQWIRHRTASVNESSARYSIMDREFYLPQPEQLAVQSTKNRQGRGEVLNNVAAEKVLTLLKNDAQNVYSHYEEMLGLDDDKSRLTRELARINLSVNFYTQFYWKINLHNLLRFLALRASSHAQYEIRVYAEVILAILKLWVPATAAAFAEQNDGHHFSVKSLNVIKELLAGNKIDQAASGLTSREWQETMAALGLSE